VFEPNYDFVRWGDNIPVAIPYDITPEDLDNLLPQLNGVWLTGGTVNLISDVGECEQHPYYKVVKSVLKYSIYQKDELDSNWPIMGVC
jgi:gamma-glutamyl-gamma-aminobutyrate hydrolase PuuD